MSDVKLTDDLDLIRDYLPELGHPQDVDESKCPYCALNRIRNRILLLEKSADQLYGAKFSDRCYHALKSRAETAEAELDASVTACIQAQTALTSAEVALIAEHEARAKAEATCSPVVAATDDNR